MAIWRVRERKLRNRNLLIYYYLLARGFAYPTPVLAAKIRTGAFGYALQAAGLRLGFRAWPEPAIASHRPDDGLEALKTEYTRLFINAPGHLPAPPYASCYLNQEGKCGQGVAELLRFYRSAGVEISRRFPDQPDHIMVELEFILYLLHESALNPGKSKALAKIRWRFLRSHFLVWVPAFTARVKEHDRNGFYGQLARATEGMLDWETNRLREEAGCEEGGGR